MIPTPPEAPGYPPTIPSTRSLRALHEVMVRCTRCDLFLSRTQVVPGAGPHRARVLVVGEAPGVSEDREGVPFVGRSGALLEAMLREAGLSRDDVFIANVVRCRPPENRNPKPVEIRACAGWLQEQIRLIRPELVITLGRFALQHFIPSAKITALQGEPRHLTSQAGAITLYPLLHPSAILRSPPLRPAYTEQFRRLPAILAAAAWS